MMFIPADDIEREFSGADFGDPRRARRALAVADALANEPDASFPAAAGGDAALEGMYRFFGNSSVTPEGILEPHFNESAERSKKADELLVVHDTTAFEFDGERTGLGKVCTNTQGFFGHFSLGVIAGEARLPTGVLAFSSIVRLGKPKQASRRWSVRKSLKSEGVRWVEGVRSAEARLEGVRPIHLMDREGDSYALMAALITEGRRFVIRCRHDRNTVEGKISEILEVAPDLMSRSVPLSKRREPLSPRSRKVHPARNERIAQLKFSSARVQLQRPRDFNQGKGLPETLSVNIVRVHEANCPTGLKPIEWVLLTTEHVNTSKAAQRVVDHYRSRWTIEEYFKALKTGCNYESRQLEGLHALRNALAVFIPIAWRLLLLRSTARTNEESPATDVLDQSQVDVLKATSRLPLPARPTVRDVLLAIAALGGHIKNNGDPGWQVIGRGYDKLRAREVGWLAAQAARKK